MSIIFDYQLRDDVTGWAILTIGNEEQSIQLDVEFMRYVLEGVARQALFVRKPMQSTTVVVENGPVAGKVIWFFREESTLRIVVRDVKDRTNAVEMAKAPILIEASGLFRDFGVRVTQVLDSLWRRHGMLNYLRLWESSCFPIDTLLALRMLYDSSPFVKQIETATRANRGVPELELKLLQSPLDLSPGGSGVELPLWPYAADYISDD